MAEPRKKVAISGVVDGLLNAKGKKYAASIHLNMDTTPYYDPQKGALFLKDVRLLSWSATPAKYQAELQMFLPVLADGLSSFLNSTPVYTLDENKTKEAMVKKFGKAIVVENGNIKLETTIF
ncbi:putative lipoprotein YceB [Mannheimia haemolytica]